MTRCNTKSLAAITALPASKRYAHFIKTVADTQTAWGLYEDGWALAATDDGLTCFLLWPSSGTALQLADGGWSKHVPREIDVYELVEELIPKLQSNGVGVAVFPTPSEEGAEPDLNQLVTDLSEELSDIDDGVRPKPGKTALT